MLWQFVPGTLACAWHDSDSPGSHRLEAATVSHPHRDDSDPSNSGPYYQNGGTGGDFRVIAALSLTRSVGCL